MFVELVCQENGEWREREVYECVNPGSQVAGMISAVAVGMTVIFVAFYFLAKKKMLQYVHSF